MQKLRDFIEYFRVDERLGWVSYTEHAQRQTERLRLVDDHKKGADAKKEDFDIVKSSFAPRSGSSTPDSGGNGSMGSSRGNGSGHMASSRCAVGSDRVSCSRNSTSNAG